MTDEPSINPYAPPRSDTGVPPPSGLEGPVFEDPLFSPRQALAASILGTLLAGVILLQANYRAMGRSATANKALVLGLLVNVVVIVGLVVLPKGVPTTPINIGLALAFYKLFESLQGESFARHREAGGPRRSNWVVFAITLGTVAAVIVVTFLVLFSSGAFDGIVQTAP